MSDAYRNERGVAPPTMSASARVWQVLQRIHLLVLPLVFFMIAFSFMHDRFLTSMNLLNVARAASVTTIIGVGMTFLITSRNIDLSVGSMLGLVMAIAGTAMKWYGVPVPIAILLALFSGALLGLINGLVVTGLKVPALLATLGTLVAYRGILNQYMYGETASRFPDTIVFLGQGMVGPIPVPVIVAAITVVLAMLAYRYTRFGRYAVAIGSNEEAAKRAGINVNFWKVSFFAVQGMLCGLAAVVYLGQLNATHPSIGTALELHIIAGTILGGTLLFGGYGSVGGMALGMYLIDVLENGLVLAGAGFFVQQIFLGILLIAAVAAQLAQRRRRELK
jgi:ribose/xylose/arabinose/galactoside ABC-type transport system permease subunit